MSSTRATQFPLFDGTSALDVRSLRSLALQLQVVSCEILERVGEPAQATSAAPAVPYMTLAEYARARNVSLSTVKRWCRLGLPCARSGRVVRVRVEDADHWNDSGAADAAIHRLASIQAGAAK